MSFDFNKIKNNIVSSNFEKMHSQSVRNIIENNILNPLYTICENYPDVDEDYIKNNLIDVDLNNDNNIVDIKIKYNYFQFYIEDKDYILSNTLIDLLCENYQYIKNDVNFILNTDNFAICISKNSIFDISNSPGIINVDITKLHTWMNILLDSNCTINLIIKESYNSIHVSNGPELCMMLKSLSEYGIHKIRPSINFVMCLAQSLDIPQHKSFFVMQNNLKDILTRISNYIG